MVLRSVSIVVAAPFQSRRKECYFCALKFLPEFLGVKEKAFIPFESLSIFSVEAEALLFRVAKTCQIVCFAPQLLARYSEGYS